MIDKRAIQIGAVVWAMVGFTVAAASLATVNSDGIILVATASVTLPGCAAMAAVALGRDRIRGAGVLLFLSAATPTYFAWALNLPALLVGVALLVAPGPTVRSSPAPGSCIT